VCRHAALLAAVTMFIGPSRTAGPLEVGVVSDEEDTAIIQAMRAAGSSWRPGGSSEQVAGEAGQSVGGSG